MRKEVIPRAALAEPVGPFVRGVRVGEFIVISGTSALSHLAGPFKDRELPAAFDKQASLAIANLHTALHAAGCSWEDVFKLLIVLKNSADYERFTQLRLTLIPATSMASTAIIAGLPRDDMLIEIEAWAVAPDSAENPPAAQGLS